MMYTLSGHCWFISFVMTAALFLSGISGYIAYAQEIKTARNLERPADIFKQDTLTVVFMGDMMMHAYQLETASRKDGRHDFSSYFSQIEDRIKEADIAVANMEFTLAGEPYEGYPSFSSPDSYAQYLTIEKVGEKTIITISYDGHKNVIEIEKNKAKMIEANCSNTKECVNSFAPITNGNQTILCDVSHVKIVGVSQGESLILNG